MPFFCVFAVDVAGPIKGSKPSRRIVIHVYIHTVTGNLCSSSGVLVCLDVCACRQATSASELLLC